MLNDKTFSRCKTMCQQVGCVVQRIQRRSEVEYNGFAQVRCVVQRIQRRSEVKYNRFAQVEVQYSGFSVGQKWSIADLAQVRSGVQRICVVKWLQQQPCWVVKHHERSLSIYLSVCLSINPSIHLFVYLHRLIDCQADICNYLFIYQYIYLSRFSKVKVWVSLLKCLLVSLTQSQWMNQQLNLIYTHQTPGKFIKYTYVGSICLFLCCLS